MSKFLNKLVRKQTIIATISVLLILSVGVFPALAQQTDAISVFTDVSDVYDTVSPSVVSISVTANRAGQNIMGQSVPEQQVQGGGSGFVYDNQGHIITNNHVVEGATDIVVSFLDGTKARATIVGLDPDSDLAVIRVDLPESDLAELQPVQFADSDALEVGEPVLAIGSPFGQRWTLTTGIVSALQRTIQGVGNFSIGGVIQTDAAINPGNSGGPLLNARGEVIGVNSQIISASGANAGIGFSIPGNLTQRVAIDLIQRGYVEYSYLGISGGDVTIDVIETFELPNDITGVVVGESVPGGPAARAGIQSAAITDAQELLSADIVTAIDGVELSSMGDLITYLASNTRPGDTITLTVLRDGQTTLNLDVVLSPRP